MYLKWDMQANWDEKYIIHMGHFSNENPGWKVSPSGKMWHLGKMSHFIRTAS